MNFECEYISFNDYSLGLGAPEGFLSSDNEEAILEVFHRYKEHQRLVEEAKPGTDGLECKDGCPEGSHCSGGVCFCNAGNFNVQLFLAFSYHRY